MLDRQIVHCDLDSFFVSVERLKNPKLNGKPVIVGGRSARSVVASCSYEARMLGVHSAMPIAQAIRLCPEAIVVDCAMKDYAAHSRQVTSLIAAYVPEFEKASIDEHYIDFTGFEKYMGCWKYVQQLRQKIIFETNLPITFALSSSKIVSKIGSGFAKPNGEIYIQPGTEIQFLAPLAINKIPMVGKVLAQKLRHYGLSTIADIQKRTISQMESLIGNGGRNLWEKARGIDVTSVITNASHKSISKETTFETDINSLEVLRANLKKMVAILAFDLRKHKEMTTCVAIKIRYNNFETKTTQMQIVATANDSRLEDCILQLFDRSYDKFKWIRLIGVKFSSLKKDGFQLDLFQEDNLQLKALNAMDQIRNKFGMNSIMKASQL